MNEKIFKGTIIVAATVFLLVFCIAVIPPLFAHPDIPGAFAAGFVNPYATGYSTDVISCWVILTAWILHERRLGIKNGWVCIVLGIAPGVAVGFALYLLIRSKQTVAPSPVNLT